MQIIYFCKFAFVIRCLKKIVIVINSHIQWLVHQNCFFETSHSFCNLTDAEEACPSGFWSTSRSNYRNVNISYYTDIDRGCYRMSNVTYEMSKTNYFEAISDWFLLMFCCLRVPVSKPLTSVKIAGTSVALIKQKLIILIITK